MVNGWHVSQLRRTNLVTLQFMNYNKQLVFVFVSVFFSLNLLGANVSQVMHLIVIFKDSSTRGIAIICSFSVCGASGKTKSLFELDVFV